MAQVFGIPAKADRCNIRALDDVGIVPSGGHLLISSNNSMQADGQGFFDFYVVGDGVHQASELTRIPIERKIPEVTEDGIFLTDDDGQTVARLDKLDVSDLSSHFEYLIGARGVPVLENGYYITDAEGYVIADLVDKTKRVKVNVLTTDSETQILEKMLFAFSVGNCDVVFERGTYTFSEVYLYMRDTLHWSWTMELPIGNGCHYYFNNSTLISNEPSESYSDSRNVLGCKAGAMGNTSFKLYDGILINNGGTYCVHDECLSATTPYSHEYHNMRMVYNNGSGTENLSKCIGGGAGPNGFFIIDNCVFYTNNPTLTTEDVSWHGMSSESTYCNLSFFVSGNYFSRKFRVAGAFKTGDTLFVKYNGNTAAAAPNITDVPTTLNTYIFNNTNS